jgi:hypothetical protein
MNRNEQLDADLDNDLLVGRAHEPEGDEEEIELDEDDFLPDDGDLDIEPDDSRDY